MLGEFVMSGVVASVPVSTAITRRAMRTRRQPAILIRANRDEGIPERSRRRSGSRGQPRPCRRRHGRYVSRQPVIANGLGEACGSCQASAATGGWSESYRSYCRSGGGADTKPVVAEIFSM
jgi:hypothetical protein